MAEKMTLEPCPFCGASKITPVRVANVGHAVSCDGCGASSEVGPSIDSAVAKWNHRHLAQPAQAVDVDYMPGELDRTAPERIWLQVDTSASNRERNELWPGDDGVSWCSEPIGGLEIQYVRGDLVTRAIGNAQAEGWTRVGTLTLQRWKGIDSMLNTDFDYAGDLPDGDYQVFVQTPSQPEE